MVEHQNTPDETVHPDVPAAQVPTSPVTLKIAQLLSDEGRIESVEDLDFVVQHHSALLSQDRIIPIVEQIPTAFTELPQTRFLQGVVFYHLQHKPGSTKEWASAFQKFSAMLPEAAEGNFLGFYIPNYSFLSLRNAGGEPADLEKLFL